jgi:sigma-B regulation protein RsbU (phosphoserine phosphatase)
MKFHWKLMLLFLLISLIPLVSLRTLGIHNVRIMADSLKEQVQQEQIRETRKKLADISADFSDAFGRIKDQVELGLSVQVSEALRNLNRPEELSRASTETFSTSPTNDRETCFSVPPDAAEKRKNEILHSLSDVHPIYHAVSQHLGKLVLWHLTGLDNGMYSIYPCPPNTRLPVDARNQFWYRSAFEKKNSPWSDPYVDDISGRIAMAVSLPLEKTGGKYFGVTGLVLSLDSLLKAALSAVDVPEDAASMICTVDRRPDTGRFGAKIVAYSQPTGGLEDKGPVEKKGSWLTSSDKPQMEAMLQEMKVPKTGSREMPFKERESYWVYGPLAPQGTAFVVIIPKSSLQQPSRELLESIEDRVKRVENITAGFLFFLSLIAVLSALVFSRTVTKPLDVLAQAAQRLASGDFSTQVKIRSGREFRELGQVFNQVGPQLQEHYRVQQALSVAKEIQKHLLPQANPQVRGLEIGGTARYCESTGGDYFDYLCVDEHGEDKLCVVVGDVTDHGIPSALMMTTARALLRLRSSMSGKLKDIVSDINREFTRDVDFSSQFMTMFLARICKGGRLVEWVRAGHDPAILYDPSADSFTYLEGKGLPLGVDASSEYEERSIEFKPGQLLFIGTDGIWETRNPGDEFFGKKRLESVIRNHAAETADSIIQSILEEVDAFRGALPQEDDVTLVIVKSTEA